MNRVIFRCFSTAASKFEFKAETRKLLDIVANSLYSEKEIFVRELISNASDALEKARHLQNTTSIASTRNLCIKISVDKDKFIIQDNGIGMTGNDMMDYLGTIAKSGSKSFKDEQNNRDIIGQFGVGFYSSFMVGDFVQVYSRTEGSKEGHLWSSDGLGTFTLAPVPDTECEVGTKIIIRLKDKDFGVASNIERIIKKHSNFITFPIYLNDKPINTIQPLWTLSPSEITQDQHKSFYRFISNNWDDFKYKMHFKTEAPIHLNALLYVPERNTELFGLQRMEPGVSLYSRKVLIQPKSKLLLPDYFRFIQGVVDSDDIPMNLSREMLQNSPIITKITNIVQKKVIKWLEGESKNNLEEYLKFYKTFGSCLKEGVCMCEDEQMKQDLAKLLRFESSAKDTMISFEEYVEESSNTEPSDKKIYYLIAQNKKWAEESPYLESFKKKKANVLFMCEPVDEIVVDRLKEFKEFKLVNIHDISEESPSDKSESEADVTMKDSVKKLFVEILGKKVSEVNVVSADHSYPALIRDAESPTMRRFMKMMPKESPVFIEEAPQKLEINSNHGIIKKLSAIVESGKDSSEQEVVKDVVGQIFDNAMIAAGIMDEPKSMLKRINRLLEKSI